MTALTGVACKRVKIHCDDGTYLGGVSPEKAARIVESGLGERVKSYIRMIPGIKAIPDDCLGSSRQVQSWKEVRLDGGRIHHHATPNNPRGVWSFGLLKTEKGDKGLKHESTEGVLAFLDVYEAMAVYGGSEAWWRKAVWLKQIPYHKRGTRVVFSRADLDVYFETRRVPARGEVA